MEPKNKNICPVCNYDGLFDPPYNKKGYPSDEICPCCGFHFGYNDDTDFPTREEAHVEWRKKWVTGGCKWAVESRPAPEGWNPDRQLKELKNRSFEILIESLQLLAANIEIQCEALPNYVHIPDEVALTYSDAVLSFLDELVQIGEVSTEQKLEIQKLDTLLGQMGSNKELWSIKALAGSEEWDQIRATAESILALLGLEKRKPNLFWLHYVETNNEVKSPLLWAVKAINRAATPEKLIVMQKKRKN